MLLSEFRELTSGLNGDLELLCAGAPLNILWHSEDCVSIDDGYSGDEVNEDGGEVLWERE